MSVSDYRGRDRAIYDRSGGRPDFDRPYHRSSSRIHERSPSPDRFRFERRPRFHDDFSDDGRSDDFVRDRRYYHDEPRYVRREVRDHSPGYEPRRSVIDLEREREYVRTRSPSPGPAPIRPMRPSVLRRQSSLDTYDRPRFFDREREEYPPPARREDFRASYGSMPISPRMRNPSARRLEYDDRDRDSLPHGYEQDRMREKEVVRVRKRRSRDSLTSRTLSRRSSTSSSSSSRTSSQSRVTSVRSDYPKKGKTKIPSRLLSKRALIDLGYPFIDEGKTIIILKALGQDQIDEVLRVSEEYKKAELEISAARSSAGDIEERLEDVRISPPVVVAQPPPAQVVVAQPEVEVVKETLVRDMSPSRATSITSTTLPSTTTGCSTCTSTTGDTIIGHHHHHGRRRYSGPLVVRSKSRSRSRSGRRDIRAEIRALEAELYEKKSRGRHHGGELVHVGDGERVVLMEEKVEKVTEGYRGPRIERDKKGRLSLSVPKRR